MESVKIIDRYLGRNTIQGFLLVLSVLVVLFSLIELLVQLNDVGKGDFRMADAFVFVALTIPKRVADLMPLAALLGSIVALGLLADHQELTAMQVAGMSVQRIAISVLATSVIIMDGPSSWPSSWPPLWTRRHGSGARGRFTARR